MVEEYLTTYTRWESDAVNEPLAEHPVSCFQPLFDRWLPKNDSWTAIEIGACPGNNLVALAMSHGYKPTALDILPRVLELPNDAKRHGLDTLEAIQHDFLQWEIARRFNVVMSFGFIEHFRNPLKVLQKHWDLVEKGGFLFVSAPMFSPLQDMLQRLVLTSERLNEVWTTHNRDATSVGGVERLCCELPGAKILLSAPYSNMNTWIFSSGPFVRPGWRLMVKLFKLAGYVPRMLNWSSRMFSPMAVVIARKQAAARNRNAIQ